MTELYSVSEKLHPLGVDFACAALEFHINDAWREIDRRNWFNAEDSISRLRGSVGTLYFLGFLQDDEFNQFCDICSGWRTYVGNERIEEQLKDLHLRYAE